MQADDTPIYEALFDMTMSMVERFPAMSPFNLRREKAREVFLLIVRFNRWSKKQKKKSSNIIRRPAGDDWF